MGDGLFNKVLLDAVDLVFGNRVGQDNDFFREAFVSSKVELQSVQVESEHRVIFLIDVLELLTL